MIPLKVTHILYAIQLQRYNGFYNNIILNNRLFKADACHSSPALGVKQQSETFQFLSNIKPFYIVQ